MRSLGRTFSLVVLLIAGAVWAACSDGSTSPGRTAAIVSTAITLGDTLNRTLTDSIGPDTLVLSADRVLRLHVDLQQTADGAAGALQYSVINAATKASLVSGVSLSSTSALGPDVGDPNLTWVRLPQTGGGTFFVVVSRTRATYRGGYRLRLVGSDPEPEHMPARLAFGDSGVESIDRPGDVDEFVLTGHALTSPPLLFLKAETGRAGDTLVVENTTDSPAKTIAVSAASELAPFGAVTPIAPGSGDSIRIRVRGLRGTTVGQYRIKWLAVSDAPEGAKDQLTAGDTVAASIEFPGDVDVFTFVPDSSKTYSLAARALGDPSGGPLRFDVRGVGFASDSLRLSLSSGTPGPLVSNMTPLFQSKKPITIRVTSDGPILGPTPYQLAVLEVSTSPESAPEVLSYGDTISESIEVKADVDEFMVGAQRGDTVIVFAQALAADTSLRLGVETTGFAVIPGLPLPARLAFAVAPGAPLSTTSSFAMVADGKGPFKVTVKGQGGDAAGPYNFLGLYRLFVAKVSGSPESVSSSISPNTVVTEDGFPSGEVDRFVFNGSSGQEIAVYLSVVPQLEGGSAVFAVQNGTFTSFGTSADSLGWFGLRRTLSDGPTYIDVQPLSPIGRSIQYRLWVYPVDRNPEIASSIVHIGDVISNEELAPSADIDEFTLSAAPGARFQGCLVNRAQTTGVEGMSLMVDSDGKTTGLLAAAPGCTPTQIVPPSGTMTLRVFTRQPHGGPYELRIIAAP